MGMVLVMRADNDSKIKELLKNPQSIEDFCECDEQDCSAESVLDLDKSWHGIHYLLTGDPQGGKEPLCYLLSSGAEIGDIDVGYGPARALTSMQIANFNDALRKIDEAEFRSRFDPQTMMKKKIYPTIWDRPPSQDDTLGYLCEYFSELKTFLQRAKDKQHGMVIWLS